MSITRIIAMGAVAISVGSAALADGTVIAPISKSTQAAPVPPVPPAVTAIFGPNAALVVGTVGVPGIVVGTVVIAGVVYSVVIQPSSSTTTTT